MADLITLQEYKTAQAITQPKDDARLNVLIPSVSQLIKTYCGNSFVDYYSSNKTETFTIDWGTHVVELTESPVNAIVSVQEAQSYGGAYTTLTTAAQEYALSTETDCVYRTTTSGYRNWPVGIETVKVVYTAGYSAIPGDLKLAAPPSAPTLDLFHKSLYSSINFPLLDASADFIAPKIPSSPVFDNISPAYSGVNPAAFV